MKTEKEHAEMMAKKFNEFMTSYSKGEVSASEAVISGVQVLKYYLESSHSMFQTPNFHIGELNKALEKTRLGAEREILDKRFLEGCLIEGLIRFGSVAEQAYAFMLGYQKITRTASIQAHKVFKKTYYINEIIQDQDNSSFVEECCDWIIDLVDKTTQRIPDEESCATAADAFTKLLESCRSAAAKVIYEGYSVRAIRPYENYEDFVKSFEIVEVVKS